MGRERLPTLKRGTWGGGREWEEDGGQTPDADTGTWACERSLGNQIGSWPRRGGVQLGSRTGFNPAIAGEPEQGHITTEDPKWRDKKVQE